VSSKIELVNYRHSNSKTNRSDLYSFLHPQPAHLLSDVLSHNAVKSRMITLRSVHYGAGV